MPLSKRNRVVRLTKVKRKKGNSSKQTRVEKLRKSILSFKNVYVFKHENMTTNPFRAIQADWSDSKFFLGKNRVMQIALGREQKDESAENLHKLTQAIVVYYAQIEQRTKYSNIFDQDICDEYARAGMIAPTTVIVPKGPKEMDKFSFSLETYLRKLGMNTSLINSKIHLNEDFVLAEKGKPLNPEQCKLLKLFEVKLAKFRITMLAVWGKGGSFKEF